MYCETFRPCSGLRLEQLKGFLRACGLDYDESIGFTVILSDEEDGIIATGSLDSATLKCIAVSPAHQGEGLTAQIMTVLRQEAFSNGYTHLMLYTKPRNGIMFREFGFFPIVETQDCLLMESDRTGLRSWLNSLRYVPGENIGAIVAHANPFTRGHRYLVEQATAQCDAVHLFILSEDKGLFSPEDRLQMAREGCADLPNVYVHPTRWYMISSATFPTYFIKDKSHADGIRCDVDIALFGRFIAPKLGINRRYVGTEPFSEITRAYNESLKSRLPEYGIRLIELPRCECAGRPVSATDVRELYRNGQTDALSALIPETTLQYLKGD